MDWVDQAVFTSQASTHAQGYHLAAASADLTDEERRALTRWGPSHDSVPDPLHRATVVSSFRLPSGRVAVARTFANGPEYSRRGAIRWYTQFLVLDEAIFRRFAANPFAILTAAIAGGCLNVHDTLPPVLPALRLLGKASPVDVAGIEYAAALVGPRFLLEVLEQLLTHNGPLVLSGAERYQRIIAGILSLLPVSFRANISFTTGLMPSSQRPFRIQPFYGPAIELERIKREKEAVVVDFSRSPAELPAGAHPWTKFISYVLNGSRWYLLKALFRRDDLPKCDDPNGLQALGRLCLEEIVFSSTTQKPRTGTERHEQAAWNSAPDVAPPTERVSTAPVHFRDQRKNLHEVSPLGDSADPSDASTAAEHSQANSPDPAALRLWSIAAEHAILAWQEGPESFSRFKTQWSTLRSRLPGAIPDAVLGAAVRRFKDALLPSSAAEDEDADKIRQIQELILLLTDD
ncbi:GAP1-N2 domain-containing protein [Thermopirellula anaerolimosa]